MNTILYIKVPEEIITGVKNLLTAKGMNPTKQNIQEFLREFLIKTIKTKLK